MGPRPVLSSRPTDRGRWRAAVRYTAGIGQIYQHPTDQARQGTGTANPTAGRAPHMVSQALNARPCRRRAGMAGDGVNVASRQSRNGSTGDWAGGTSGTRLPTNTFTRCESPCPRAFAVCRVLGDITVKVASQVGNLDVVLSVLPASPAGDNVID